MQCTRCGTAVTVLAEAREVMWAKSMPKAIVRQPYVGAGRVMLDGCRQDVERLKARIGHKYRIAHISQHPISMRSQQSTFHGACGGGKVPRNAGDVVQNNVGVPAPAAAGLR